MLREVFNGSRRLDDLRIRTAIPGKVLSNRLANLVEHDFLHPVPCRRPGSRQRYEYRLIVKGFDLYPLPIAIRD